MRRFIFSSTAALGAAVLLAAALPGVATTPGIPDQNEPTSQLQPAVVAPQVAPVAEAAEAKPEERPLPPTSAPLPTKGPTPVPASTLRAAADAAKARNGGGSALRVGVQAGHWKSADEPDELSVLRTSTGAEGPGWKEVDVNLSVAQRVTGLLAGLGVTADLIPATVPPHYKASAFVAIHADANSDASYSGFKAARYTKSAIPQQDDALLSSVRSAYQATTGLPWHGKTITEDMLRYYAFNQRFTHSVAPTTPAIILEMGFLTNSADNHLLTTQPDIPAQAITLGILNFLAR